MKILKLLLRFLKNLIKLENRGFGKFSTKKEADGKGSGENVFKRKRAKYQSAYYLTLYTDVLPEVSEIKEKTIYIVGEKGYYWLAAFKCPCGCNDLIQLNLLNHASPSWKIINDNNPKISILPSIDRNVGCKSHFSIKNSRVLEWRDNSS